MVVNFNGEVSVCELDWTMTMVAGNARDESMWDIWNGEKYHAYRLMMLEGKRWSQPACKECSCVTYMPVENDMDDHKDRLLKLYNRLGPDAPAKAWAMRKEGTWAESE
jgi:MoaA/NifB/PqqE/SkfB family radical SAM enzyme